MTDENDYISRPHAWNKVFQGRRAEKEKGAEAPLMCDWYGGITGY
jgi:hypothetical protein